MSMRRFLLQFSGLVLGLSFGLPHSTAQSPNPPQTYSVTETNAMAGAGVIMTIYRDGSKAVIEHNSPSTAASPNGSHTRTLYDLEAHRTYSWNTSSVSNPCGSGTFSGDWGDPFAGSADTAAQIAQLKPTELGKETINGFSTKVLQADIPGGTGKIWLDEKSGLIIKSEMAPKNGPVTTMVEIKQLSFAKPPASLFVLPPSCAQAAAQAPAPTESQRIAAETGGSAEGFVNAIMPPPSHDSCTVLLKVVRAGKLERIASGFQVGLDTTDSANPSYQTGVATDGHVRFSGGGVRDMTGQFQNGVLRISSPPPHFQMMVHFSAGVETDALIYRQCFKPETTLLLVVNSESNATKPSDWLWVK